MTHTLPAPMRRENLIVFCGGRKASGKSLLVERQFARAAPRIIRLDFVGDVAERHPTIPEVVGIHGVLAELARVARISPERWAMVAVFDDTRLTEVETLFRLMVPVYAGRAGAPGLSRAFGGVTIECTECDIILPNTTGADHAGARNALRRGRHERLSLLLATQRPQDCARLCTAQADVLISFATHEPRELDYWRRGAGEAFAARLPHLPKYTSLWLDRRAEDPQYIQVNAAGERGAIGQCELFDGPDKDLTPQRELAR